VLQVKSEQLIAVDCGVIDVTAVSGDGARCAALRRELQPLFDPPPVAVFSEKFFAHPPTKGKGGGSSSSGGGSSGHQGVAINYKLRGVVEEEVATRDLPFADAQPNEWKSSIGVGGNEEDKTVIKAKLEATFGAQFPAKLPNPNGGRDLNFRTDASDAVGIGVWGLQRQHASLSMASPIVISTPALRTGTRAQSKPVPPNGKSPMPAPKPAPTVAFRMDTESSTASNANAAASNTDTAAPTPIRGHVNTSTEEDSPSTSTTAPSASTTMAPSPMPIAGLASSGTDSAAATRDKWTCGDNGCRLPRHHPGLCQIVVSSPRRQTAPNFRELSGRRISKRPREDSAPGEADATGSEADARPRRSEAEPTV